MIETEKILRSVLLHVKTSTTLKEAEIAIENMCDDDWIASANEAAERIRNQREQNKK